MPGVKIYRLANAVTFKVDPFREAFQKSGKKLKLVHRLDGPYYSASITKIRGRKRVYRIERERTIECIGLTTSLRARLFSK